jgi:hypothetical protein
MVKRADIQVYEYDGDILGNKVFGIDIEVKDDIIELPGRYGDCINLQQDCSCL